MPQTKFIRIAVEGDTTDGRALARTDIEQMGKNYNREKYGARIWLEHIRGILPDSSFKAYGDVLETKAEEVTIDGQKKLALFAKLDVTEELVAINKQRQKIYTSIEIYPNFAKSGEAYLGGLAVTDSPASLGTEALKLFSHRKQEKDNLFTAAVESTLEFEEEKTSNVGAELFTKVKNLLTGKSQQDDKNFTGIAQAVEVVAESQKQLLDKFSGALASLETLQSDIKKISEAAEDDRKNFNELKTTLSQEPENKNKRPAATGADGKVETDC